MISERVFSRIGDNAFLGGILHDIGMIVEDQVVNDLFLEVCRIYRPDERSFVECENELIGTNHCEVGYLLAQELNVPDEVAEGIRDHHAILGEMTSSNFSGIIQLADFLTAKLKFDVLPGMHPTLAPNIAVHLGANLDEYKAIGRDLPEEIAKAEELYRP
jgi:HD-like signal output (HDOD) protein